MRAAVPWLVVAAVLALVALAGWVTYGTSVLGVRQVRVEGAAVLTAAQVQQAAAVRAGTPLARADLSGIRERVARLAPVERVTVSRDWPHTVVVAVTERTAVAVVPQDKKFLLVDRAGVLFTTVAERPSGLPAIEAGSPADTASGVQVLVALTPQLRDDLISITVDGPARIRLALAGGREVIWGDSGRSELKAKVATALLTRAGSAASGGQAAGGGTTYDVSAPDVVTIR